MTYYHWIMIILGVLGIIGSAILFGIKVLRYLWRIELAVESLVEQNKNLTEENKVRDKRIANLEKFAVLNEIDFKEEGLAFSAKKKYNV